MKKVIIYVRVSTDEQAGKGYSLRDQEQKLINYCQTNNLNILSIFREDYSAKTFKRPEFKKLLDFSSKNKKDIDQLLFIKWDRFSRNTAESYQMISTFDNLGIQVNAIEQPLDLTIPEQGLMLAVYLSIPQVENHRRSLNVIGGMRRAFKEGRYVGSAPKGYNKERDSTKKPILVPNAQAKLVQEAFELIATGLYNQKEVMLKMNKKGLNTSKTPFSQLLKNPIYYGGVPIKAFKDEEECVVDGIHEPIITKALFDQVQDVLNNRRKKHHTTHKKLNENFPLKGFLRCPKCNKPLTGSTSKGRSKHYTYYHCISPCNERYKLEDVELWITDFLKGISMKNEVKDLFTELVKEEISKQNKTQILGPKHYEKVENLKQKLNRLQDIYLDGEIDKEEYQTAKKRYTTIYEELKAKEADTIHDNDIVKTYKEAINKIEKIDLQYIKSSIEDKRKILGSIFPNNFQFENKKVRTADINPVLNKIASINKTCEGKKKWDKTLKKDLSHRAERMGFEPTMQLPTYKLSRLAPSTTRTPL